MGDQVDRITKTADVIKSYYTYKRTQDASSFVKEVCAFFDYIKDKTLTESDMNLLIFLANEAGIPQYFDLLNRKFTECQISEENVKTLTLGAIFHDASLIRGDFKLHRYQKNVIECFKYDENNRYVLTAPTSFGKTFLVYEIIQKMQYKNILLIFPAISLLSENYGYLCEAKAFKDYSIHSLSEEEFNLSEKNIFIFTPERFLSFMDTNHDIYFDFAFIDEIYKIDNSFILDQETISENERDMAYRLALEFICQKAGDMLLAGPYITLPHEDQLQEKSFINFAKENNFSFLRYNQFEIVSKEYTTIKTKKRYFIDNIPVEIGAIKKYRKIANIISSISTPTENTIIYCSRRSDTEHYAKQLLQDTNLIKKFQKQCSINTKEIYEIFLTHLENTFGSDWVVLRALKGRIGIHHSLIPKYIQKEIIHLFNSGELLCLFSTTTITEGVNTSAKNIIITSHNKGTKPLKQFDAKNIAGRAGRFYQHYSGRVIDLNNDFEKIINSEPEVLEHKNYELLSQKTDVDYQITKEQYLSEAQREDKKKIESEIIAAQIPVEVFNCFRVVGPKDKLKMYKYIMEMSGENIQKIQQLSTMLSISSARKLYWPGFQVVIDIIFPVVREDKLKNLISTKFGSKQYSLLTILLNEYLSEGFLGMANYYVTRNENPKTMDEAMRSVADYVYNVFKYHLVKYLGLFDLFFRYWISKLENKDMEEVTGLGLLLQKLEYNALSSKARKVSDYGVPFKLINYYDSPELFDTKNFDKYERHIAEEIHRLFD